MAGTQNRSYKLRILSGPYGGREKTLGDKNVSIGRDSEATIQILDRSASRFHAEVFPVGGMYFVRDLLSKNGTYLNTERLEDEELLREGDIIKIGTTELLYEAGAALNEDSSSNIAYDDDPSVLSNTLEFRVDDLQDLQDEEDAQGSADARTLQILYQIGKIVGSGTPTKVHAQVLDYLINAMPADNAIIFLRNRKSGKLAPHTVRSSSKQREPVIARTIIRRAIMENRAVLTANAQADERFNRRDSVILGGIRSVVCVPLSIAGQTRGVLYVSRNDGGDAFTQHDLEMVSSCAVLLGLSFQAAEQQQRQRRVLWNALTAMVKIIESQHNQLGSGERCARSATALARSLGLGESTIERVQIAALLHHLDGFMPGDGDEALEAGLSLLASIEGFADIIPLIENASCYLGVSQSKVVQAEDLDVEERILHVAISFEQAMLENPGADALETIETLAKNPRLDTDVLEKLKACHLSGGLYASVF